jgi:cell division septation protein DedD
MKRVYLGGLLAGVVLLGAAVPVLSAQSGELDAVRAGRAQEARAELSAWWDDGRSGASRADAQRGLWLRGRLTEDPDQAARDYRRLMVEYPGGPFTDGALFRLAQSAFANGDGEAARALMASLARDYSGSAVMREAETWFVGAGAPVPPSTAMPIPEDDEPQPLPAAAEAAASPPTVAAGTDSPRASGTSGRYSVQLGAFSSLERAESVRSRAQDAGLDVRTVSVRGSSLLHVRVGRFDSSGEASVFFRRVTGLGFSAAVVRDADKEEKARARSLEHPPS